MHGFDCILCHCPGSKCDKRTACRGETIGEGEGGGEGQEETKTRQKVWTTRYEPQKKTLQYREWQLPSTQNHPHWLAHEERTQQGEQ